MKKAEKIKAYTMLLEGKGYERTAEELMVEVDELKELFGGFAFRTAKFPVLEKWINDNGYTQKEIGNAIGYTDAYVNACLKGKMEFSKKAIDGLLELTGMKYEELFKA